GAVHARLSVEVERTLRRQHAVRMPRAVQAELLAAPPGAASAQCPALVPLRPPAVLAAGAVAALGEQRAVLVPGAPATAATGARDRGPVRAQSAARHARRAVELAQRAQLPARMEETPGPGRT